MNPQQTPVAIETDALTCICVISAIQLATRHPMYNGPSRQVTEDFARALQERVANAHPEVAAVMEMGWNPLFDINQQ